MINHSNTFQNDGSIIKITSSKLVFIRTILHIKVNSQAWVYSGLMITRREEKIIDEEGE